MRYETANTSVPKATPRTVQLVNFPQVLDHERTPVRLKRICLSLDGSQLVGAVVAMNLGFQKVVAVRFTTDFWQTISEVTAEYSHSGDHLPGDDEFKFTIDVDSPETKTMFLCVRYAVNGQEFWDNNRTLNYQINIISQLHDSNELQAICQSHVLASLHSHPLSWRAATTLSAQENFESLVERIASQPRIFPDGVANERHDILSRALSNRYSLEESLLVACQPMASKEAKERVVLNGSGRLVGSIAGSAGCFNHLSLLSH